MKTIISFAMAALLFSSCGKMNGPDTVIAAYSGDVRVNNSDGVTTGKKIKTGDIIEVGKKSFCILVINEKNVIRLNSGSKLKFSIDREKGLLELEKGWFSAVIRRKFTKSGLLEIKTPTVVASVRGTSVCAKVESEKSTYFCVCNGVVELSSDDVMKVESTHHSAKRFLKGKGDKITVQNDPGLLYHNDKTLEDLAAVIDEKMDWTTIEK